MDHPITPPPELVEKWEQEGMRLWQKDHYNSPESPGFFVSTHLATQAARWGADQELEACCEWLREARNHGFGYDMGRILADNLRAVRRPKPPSLAEEGLEALKRQAVRSVPSLVATNDCGVIRAALERLKELENGND